MIFYILRRTIAFLFILFLLSQICFVVAYYIPNTPIDNLSLGEAYITFFDILYFSPISQDSIPIYSTVKQTIPATIELFVLTIFASVIIGVPLGAVVGLNTDDRKNSFIQSICLIISSTPLVWIAVLLVFAFANSSFSLSMTTAAVKHINVVTEFPLIDIFLTPGIDKIDHLLDEIKYLAIPILILSIHPITLTVQLISQSIYNISHQNYIKAASIREHSQLKILFRHILPNAVPPIFPQLLQNITVLLFSVMVVEIILQRPGFGPWIMSAYQQQDGMQIVTAMFVCGILIGLLNLMGEFVAIILHPLRHKELYAR